MLTLAKELRVIESSRSDETDFLKRLHSDFCLLLQSHPGLAFIGHLSTSSLFAASENYDDAFSECCLCHSCSAFVKFACLKDSRCLSRELVFSFCGCSHLLRVRCETAQLLGYSAHLEVSG